VYLKFEHIFHLKTKYLARDGRLEEDMDAATESTELTFI